jgi:hypothetical protein
MELKPCFVPWCKGVKNVEVYNASNRYFVCCENCLTESNRYDTEAEAIAAWNHRPIEDELRARVIELDEKLTQQLLVNTMLLERNEKLEQWQERAVEAIKACREKDDGAYLYDTKMANLIEQAEGE